MALRVPFPHDVHVNIKINHQHLPFGCLSLMSFMKVMGEASKSTTNIYPNLLGASVMCNPLSSLSIIASALKLLLPASVLEKMKMCGASSTVTGDIAQCPIARMIFHDLETLPSFLGGKCQCKGGCCIGGVKNDCREKLQPVDI